MKKYTLNTIRQETLTGLLNSLVGNNERTLYISACRQYIKMTKTQVYNVIGGNTSIPIQYLDHFGKEITTLDISDHINYIKSKTGANISFKAGGIVIVDETMVYNNVKILVSLRINTIKQLLELMRNSDSIILKFEKLKQDSTMINYDNSNIKDLIIDRDIIFTNLFLSGEMIRRLIKLSSIGIIETCITDDDILLVGKFQIFIRKKLNIANNQNIDDLFLISKNNNQHNFNIADLFMCYGNRPGSIYSGIKLIGAEENCNIRILTHRTKICLNYIKYMDKFQDLISRLEQIKLSII